MDRQDIDALLIGALYGELTPADEARLSAHLDSHPTDRGALDDLKSARQAVRESRIFDLQLDPPQAVSALLLQEAHRRAPKRVVAREEKESWFYRFSKMFLAHPAMAAAAMLVLVVGVASMLYVRKGEDGMTARPEVAMPTAMPADNAELDPAPPATTATTEGNLVANEAAAQSATGSAVADDGYRVGLADAEAKPADSNRKRGEVDNLKAQQQALEKQERAKRKSTAIVVDTPRPQPKELDEAPRAKAGKAAPNASTDRLDFDSSLARGSTNDGFVGSKGTATASAGPSAPSAPSAGAAAPGRAATPSRNAPAQGAQPAPPPPPAPAAPAPSGVAQAPTKAPTTSAPATKPASPSKTVTKETDRSGGKADAPAKDTTLIAWAKGEHKRALSLASSNCTAAAKVVVAIQNKAPDYFSQYVATDRGLKKCQAYIAAERDAEAERANKSRAQKRVNADEPAAESVK